MRYINLLLIIALSLFTLSLAQDSGHSHDSDHHTTEEHKTEEETSDHHGSEGHAEEHSEGHGEESSDNHGTEDHHNSDDDHHKTEETSEHHGHGEESSDHHSTEDHHNSDDDHHDSENHDETSDHHSSDDDHHNDNHDAEKHHGSEDESHHNHSDDSHMEHDSAHDHHNSENMPITSANKVMLGKKMLRLYPLLNTQGDFQIMVQSDQPGYTTSASLENTPILTTFDKAGLTQIDLGKAEEGNYYLTFRDTDHELEVPVSVYKHVTQSGKEFTTIFAPSPSLSFRGQSEVFIYNIEDGVNKHEEISVNYNMQGMQHSTDDTITPLGHEHFDGLRTAISVQDGQDENPVLEDAMSNRSALSFAMAGTWQFRIMIDGAILTFNIDMLDQ